MDWETITTAEILTREVLGLSVSPQILWLQQKAARYLVCGAMLPAQTESLSFVSATSDFGDCPNNRSEFAAMIAMRFGNAVMIRLSLLLMLSMFIWTDYKSTSLKL